MQINDNYLFNDKTEVKKLSESKRFEHVTRAPCTSKTNTS